MKNIFKITCISFLFFTFGTITFLSGDQVELLNRRVFELEKKLDVIQKKLIDLSDENQKNSPLNKLIESFRQQQNSLAISEELNHILVKYGNNPDGMTTLHYAIKMGDIKAVSTLIANGADTNSKDSQNTYTALSLAASCNQLEIAKILLYSGANVNLAATKGNYYPIYYAAESGSEELITLLLEFGAKLDCVNDKEPSKYPLTPLHVACGAGNFDTIKALIYHRARIDGFINRQMQEPGKLKWQDGTPLDWAVCKLTYKANPQNLEIIKYLVENGATRRVTGLYIHGAPHYVYCPVIGEYLRSLGITDY